MTSREIACELYSTEAIETYLNHPTKTFILDANHHSPDSESNVGESLWWTGRRWGRWRTWVRHVTLNVAPHFVALDANLDLATDQRTATYTNTYLTTRSFEFAHLESG